MGREGHPIARGELTVDPTGATMGDISAHFSFIYPIFELFC